MKGVEQYQKAAVELLSKQGYKAEGTTKIGKDGRRVTIYTTIETKETETSQEAIDRISEIISQEIGRKVVGRPLKS